MRDSVDTQRSDDHAAVFELERMDLATDGERRRRARRRDVGRVKRAPDRAERHRPGSAVMVRPGASARKLPVRSDS
jgi:hypothetical protein